jgi:hypothetical protein
MCYKYNVACQNKCFVITITIILCARYIHPSLSFYWDQVQIAQPIDLRCYKKDVELPLKIVFIASKFQEGIDGCTSIYSTVKVIGRNISYKTLLQHGEKKCNLELHIFDCNLYLAREI